MLRIFLGALLGLALLGGSAHAQLSVQPAISEFTERNGAYSGSLTVVNGRNEAVPVEISIHERVFGAGGDEELVDASGNFMILPPLATIPANTTQTVRFEWIAGPLGNESRSFRFYVTEVLAPLSEEELANRASGVRLREQFGASTHLVPQNASSDPELIAVNTAAPVEGVDGDIIDLTIRNSGTRFVYPFELAVVVGDRAIAYEDLIAVPLSRPIGPGATETVSIRKPDGLSALNELSISVLSR